MSYFNAYGELAKRDDLAPLYRAVRMPSQAAAEKLILPDVRQKLDLSPDCRLLEIGCGPGNLLIPLSFEVAHAVGIDHPNVVDRCRHRYSSENIEWVGAEFPAAEVQGSFDRVLIYAMLHYLPDFASALSLIAAALDRLDRGGRMLIGDLPNVDRKRRFLSTAEGQAFEAKWRRGEAASPDASLLAEASKVFDECEGIGAFTDAQVGALFAYVRSQGFDCYVLPQPPELPFGNTREDMLILRP